MRPGRWVALLSLAIVALVVTIDLRRTSPGDLAAAHAQVTKLLGGGGCVECHGDERQSMERACVACHADVGAQIGAQRGLHGQLAAALQRNCAYCHLEHHGESFQIVGARSFALAGIDDVEQYRHEGLDYRLFGRHGEIECKACHELAECAVLPEGRKRFLGLRQECTSCHEDPHDGKLPDCASCHGQERPFAAVDGFVHDERFPLVGGHAEATCKACHGQGTAFSIESLGTQRLRPTELTVRACADCHLSAHAVVFLDGVARELGTLWSQTCTTCHEVHDVGGFRAPSERMTPALHAASGFVLAPPHADLECAKCHAPSAEAAFAERYPGRVADRCEACHRDPHEGQFAGSAVAGGGCRSCHDAERFTPPAFSLAQHQRTAFPLTGAHEAVSCDRCHAAPEVGGTNQARVFHGTPQACASCHADVHDGRFDRPGLPAHVDGRVGCARCHDTDSFAAVDPQPFDHDTWTGYPLRGAHARAQCTACHAPTVATAASPRSFGKAPRECAACHDDPHAGQFGNGPAIDCARCHTDGGGWQQLRFDHDQHSRFALDDSHRQLACAACHKSYPRNGGGDLVRYKPLGTACTDCHGQFVPQVKRRRR